MANMFPEKLVSGCSQGEKDVFSLLQNLDDDYIVYHNPSIKQREPDFVVIMRDSILVIEVKGYRKSEIVEANLKNVVIKKDGKNETQTHPLEQARGYVITLLNHIKEQDRKNNRMLDDTGRLKVPIHYMVVLSNITKDQLGDLSSVFTPDTSMYRDELKALLDRQLSSEDLVAVLREYMQSPHLKWGKNFVDEEVKYLQALIHPEVVVRYTPDDIQMLDKEQTEVALKLGGGHRLIRGVAGSGKTIILMAKAKMLSDRKVLFICYNRALADEIRKSLQEYPNISVMTFHQLLYNKHKLSYDEPNLEEKIKSLQPRSSDKFDAIFVDEAQDFKPVWVEFLLSYHKEPLDGDFFIAGDNAQSLYYDGSSPVRFASIGVDIQGKTTVLRRSYRATRQVMEIAQKIVYEKTRGYFENLSPDKDSEAYEYLVDGTEVEIVRTSDVAKSTNEYVDRLSDRDGLQVLIYSEKSPEWSKISLGEKSTFSKAKGLQWRHVIVVVSCFDEPPRGEYMTSLYVAITRSMGKLTIIVDENKSKKFLDLMD